MAYKYRVNARKDDNQKDIVKTLRQIPGVSVEEDKDDILVGYLGATYWFEIKNPDHAISKKTGKVREKRKQASQKDLDSRWTGHREYAVNVDDILKSIGIL